MNYGSVGQGICRHKVMQIPCDSSIAFSFTEAPHLFANPPLTWLAGAAWHRETEPIHVQWLICGGHLICMPRKSWKLLWLIIIPFRQLVLIPGWHLLTFMMGQIISSRQHLAVLLYPSIHPLVLRFNLTIAKDNIPHFIRKYTDFLK